MSRGSLRSLAAIAATTADGARSFEDGAWHAGRPLSRATMAFTGDVAVTITAFGLPEVVTVPRHVRSARVETALASELVDGLSALPLDATVIDALPEGPTAAERAAQRFAVGVVGRSVGGVVRRAVVEGRDTYGTTAAVAVELAMRLVDGVAPVGVLAPAQAFPPAAVLDALAGCGVRWRLEALAAR
jgi:short subunit dehydrogenase-like uncharacterized protein